MLWDQNKLSISCVDFCNFHKTHFLSCCCHNTAATVCRHSKALCCRLHLNMGLDSAPPHTGPNSSEAHGLRPCLPQQDEQNPWSTDNVNVIYESDKDLAERRGKVNVGDTMCIIDGTKSREEVQHLMVQNLRKLRTRPICCFQHPT